MKFFGLKKFEYIKYRRFDRFLPVYLVSNVVVLIHSFDLLNSLDHLHHHHPPLLLLLRYYNQDHILLHHHQSELKILNEFSNRKSSFLLPLEILILLPSSSPSKSRYCSLSNFNCCSSSFALIFLSIKK
jgi:hypothetical protein